ncbi:putative uncharacterized protein [Xanthomonas citri pv. punicae str. LMG 859]|nr:putative uncharacterized protein [Xanthomonas citri pv. punicae str. LMG 859]
MRASCAGLVLAWQATSRWAAVTSGLVLWRCNVRVVADITACLRGACGRADVRTCGLHCSLLKARSTPAVPRRRSLVWQSSTQQLHHPLPLPGQCAGRMRGEGRLLKLFRGPKLGHVWVSAMPASCTQRICPFDGD